MFEKFREGILKCWLEKLNLLQPEITLSGVVVTQDQISPDPKKVKSVRNLRLSPKPLNN